MLIYIALVLAFTFFGVYLYKESEPLGVFRGFSNIPLKAVQLLGFGLLLGIFTTLGCMQLTVSNIIYPVSFLVLLDLDHLPSLIGVSQIIRPAHSLIFLGITILMIFLIHRCSAAIPIIFLSTFIAHLGLDSPLFPLLTPLSLEIFEFNSKISTLLLLFSLNLAWIGGKLINISETRS